MLSAGYCLWTASSSAGSTISAGLPDIKGTIDYYTYGTGTYTAGAFHGDWNANTSAVGGSSSGHNYNVVYFNASSSNSIYGNSTTVQPPAIKVYMWRRTA